MRRVSQPRVRRFSSAGARPARVALFEDDELESEDFRPRRKHRNSLVLTKRSSLEASGRAGRAGPLGVSWWLWGLLGAVVAGTVVLFYLNEEEIVLPLGIKVKKKVMDWIQQALQALSDAGTDVSTIDPNAIALIIQHESAGDPNIQNNWDSNAKKGTPSIGLMQVIQPTFDKYKLPGLADDLRDPIANIAAGVRYAIARYGSIANVPGVVAVNAGKPYVGY